VSRVRYIRLEMINVDTHMLSHIVSFIGMRVQAFIAVLSMDLLMQQTGQELSNVKASIPCSYAHKILCDRRNDSGQVLHDTMCRSCRRRSPRMTFTHHPSAQIIVRVSSIKQSLPPAVEFYGHTARSPTRCRSNTQVLVSQATAETLQKPVNDRSQMMDRRPRDFMNALSLLNRGWLVYACG
jgi:hypothetical protein